MKLAIHFERERIREKESKRKTNNVFWGWEKWEEEEEKEMVAVVIDDM